MCVQAFLHLNRQICCQNIFNSLVASAILIKKGWIRICKVNLDCGYKETLNVYLMLPQSLSLQFWWNDEYTHATNDTGDCWGPFSNRY